MKLGTSCLYIRKLSYILFFINLLWVSELLATENRSEKILFIGDSHSYGGYGEVLDKFFRSISNEVISISVCGSSPSTWMTQSQNLKSTNCGYWRKTSSQEIRAKTHKIESFTKELKNFEPSVTVISLGTNILSSPTNIQRELKYIRSMLEEVSKQGSQCVWIGPPDLKKNPFKENLSDGVLKIRNLVENQNCLFIDSTKLIRYPEKSSDGIHYPVGKAKDWGEAVKAELLTKQFLKKDSDPQKGSSDAWTNDQGRAAQ